MGTGGTKVIRDRGYYYLWYVASDGYPEGLGVDTYRMIPKSPGLLGLWMRALRKKLVALRHAYYAALRKHGEEHGAAVHVNGEWVAIKKYWDYDAEMFVYEIDLDNMVFLFQRYPVYRLDHMPPNNIFLRSCKVACKTDGFDCYREFCERTPEEYRLDLAHIKAPVALRGELATYKKLCTGVVADPYSLLPLFSQNFTPAEDLSLHLLANYVRFYQWEKLVAVYHDLALPGGRKGRGLRGYEIAWLFAAMALFPLHILGTPPYSDTDSWTKFFENAHNRFWFIRRHICVTIGFYLLDEKNANYHVAGLVKKIISTPDSPVVTYGVVFSLFHCIVVRVDKAAGGQCSRTEALEFLPSPIDPPNITSITPGMKVLTRLGHLSGADDIDVFYTHLSTRWWAQESWGERRDHDPCQESAGSPPQLPLEILMMIASEVEQPEALFDFALASKATMAAAMPRLRLPQVWGRALRGTKTIGLLLDSRVNDEFPAKFGFCHKGGRARMSLVHGGGMDNIMDWRMSLGVSDGRATMPRARFAFKHTCGTYFPALDKNYARLSDSETFWNPHVDLGFYTWWTPEAVKAIRAVIDRQIAENGGTIPSDLEVMRAAIESEDFEDGEDPNEI